MFIFSVLVLVGILTIWFIADSKEFLAFFGVLLSGAIGLLLLAILGLGVLAALMSYAYFWCMRSEEAAHPLL